MKIDSIHLRQFRSYENYELRFDDHITVITGRNGVGKTNLLEAVHVLFEGSSFRGADRELIQYEKSWWRIDGSIGNQPRQIRYQLDKRPAKQIILNETPKRFSFTNKLPLVLFEPNDLLFISGSPSRRRDAIDRMITTLSHEYKTALGRYERVVMQRNNALKRSYSTQKLRDMLFVWDVSLAHHAEIITNARADFITEINARLPYYYEQIAGELHDVTLRYIHSIPPHSTNSAIMALLDKTMPRDIERRTSTKGPHRDDFIFILGGVEAKMSASRGEVRSLILSLKLAYRDMLAERFETPPLLLLDDVFSELDDMRQQNLLASTEQNQIIITDTKKITGFGRVIEL